jgi:prepilin-type N-terminal cleavage/methylation domain-containing protein
MPTTNTKILQKHATKGLGGFTLVELIVVITILAILGTIGFVSIQGYSSSARDSMRIGNLNNLQKGLNVFQIKSGIYPLPENPVNVTAS